MFAKPINMMLVYIVTAFNLSVLALPVIALAVPYIQFGENLSYIAIENDIYEKAKIAIFFLLFISSFLMLVYFILDFIFGFSVKASTKKCFLYTKEKDYDFLDDIFRDVQQKFDRFDVKLLIKKSDEINAYALGGLRLNYIVLTNGIINHYLAKSHNMDDFLLSIRSILGHEMSHIVNKDFLPTYLIIANQRMTNFVSNSVYVVFVLVSKMISRVPYTGRYSNFLIHVTYSVLHFFLTLFNRLIVYNVYEFLRRFISRSIEYRCDRQSALAFGGINMSTALSLLGKRGYFTLFSTHPTTNSRIKKVTKIESSQKFIKSSLINKLSNFSSFIFLFVVCFYFFYQAQLHEVVKYYIRNNDLIYSYVLEFKQLLFHYINKLLNLFDFLKNLAK